MSAWACVDGRRVGVAGACCNSCAEGKPCDGASAGLKPQVDAHMLGNPIGVGDAAAFAKAQADLASMGVPIAQGDWAFGTGDYVTAITSYKAAGNIGAVTIGPEIDAAGAPQATQQYTQAAWQINDQQLGPVQPTNDQQIAQTAGQAAANMMQNYQAAITAGLRALAQPGPQPPGPQPPAPPGPSPQPPAPAPGAQKDYTVPILVGAGVVGAGIIGWALYGKRKR